MLQTSCILQAVVAALCCCSSSSTQVVCIAHMQHHKHVVQASHGQHGQLLMRYHCGSSPHHSSCCGLPVECHASHREVQSQNRTRVKVRSFPQLYHTGCTLYYCMLAVHALQLPQRSITLQPSKTYWPTPITSPQHGTAAQGNRKHIRNPPNCWQQADTWNA